MRNRGLYKNLSFLYSGNIVIHAKRKPLHMRAGFLFGQCCIPIALETINICWDVFYIIWLVRHKILWWHASHCPAASESLRLFPLLHSDKQSLCLSSYLYADFLIWSPSYVSLPPSSVIQVFLLLPRIRVPEFSSRFPHNFFVISSVQSEQLAAEPVVCLTWGMRTSKAQSHCGWWSDIRAYAYPYLIHLIKKRCVKHFTFPPSNFLLSYHIIAVLAVSGFYFAPLPQCYLNLFIAFGMVFWF